MRIRDDKGSITIFVLVGLLFMSAFLLLSYADNVSKSKIAKEQFNMISGIYSHNDGDAKAYERAYTALRKKNADTLSASVENTSTLKLTKTFEDKISNYKIYGNSEGVGNKTVNLFDYETHLIESQNGLTSNINSDGSITTSGIPTADYIKIIPAYEITDILEDKETYIFSQSNPNDKLYLQVGIQNISTSVFDYKHAIAGSNNFKVDKDTYKYFIMIQSNTRANWGNESTSITSSYQLQKSSSLTDFEPYGYKIPVKVSAKNKNKFNINKIVSSTNVINNNDGTISVKATSGSSGVSASEPRTLKDYAPDLEVGKTYILSANTTGKSKIIYLNKSGSTWTFGKTRTITESDLNSIVYWYANGDTDTSFTATISNIQIEEGSQVTEYEPYKEKTINIYIDEPLKAGDYIDFKSQQVIRSDGTKQTVTLPELESYEDYTKIEVATDVVPSKIEVEYLGYTFE